VFAVAWSDGTILSHQSVALSFFHWEPHRAASSLLMVLMLLMIHTVAWGQNMLGPCKCCFKDELSHFNLFSFLPVEFFDLYVLGK
jgi:hypothetical protein